jgi:methylated-DNA-[protein]-cysteine S-methyltransferase
MGNARQPEICLWLRREGVRAGALEPEGACPAARDEERGSAAWFGIAEAGGRLVATSVARTRKEAYRVLSRCLPAGAAGRVADGPSELADRISRMLAAIEAGDESGKLFELSGDYIQEPAASVYRLVAAIPLGYATSYGRVAAAAGTVAREVGRCMACNPLYPIVPCHRVVGSDYSLVGYRGATSGPDLDDKLSRIRAEARGRSGEISVGPGGILPVFPVELVIEKAEGPAGRTDRQLSLW